MHAANFRAMWPLCGVALKLFVHSIFQNNQVSRYAGVSNRPQVKVNTIDSRLISLDKVRGNIAHFERYIVMTLEQYWGEEGGGGIGVYWNPKNRTKLTLNRKTEINFDQNRKPDTKPSKLKIYTLQF